MPFNAADYRKEVIENNIEGYRDKCPGPCESSNFTTKEKKNEAKRIPYICYSCWLLGWRNSPAGIFYAPGEEREKT